MQAFAAELGMSSRTVILSPSSETEGGPQRTRMLASLPSKGEENGRQAFSSRLKCLDLVTSSVHGKAAKWTLSGETMEGRKEAKSLAWERASLFPLTDTKRPMQREAERGNPFPH